MSRRPTDNTKEIENFIIDLIKSDLINTNCEASKETVRKRFLESNLKYKYHNLWSFLMLMYKKWYVFRFNKTIVIFNRNWMRRFKKRIKSSQTQKFKSVESKFIDQSQCKLCNVKLINNYHDHLDDINHKIRLMFFTNSLSFLENSKTIPINLKATSSNEISSRNVISGSVNSTILIQVNVQNLSLSMYNLQSAITMNPHATELKILSPKLPCRIPPGAIFSLSISGKFENSCSFPYPMVFVMNKPGFQSEYILKKMEFDIKSEFSQLIGKPVEASMEPTPAQTLQSKIEEVIAGLEIMTLDEQYKETVKLEQYNIPEGLDKKLKVFMSGNPEFTNKKQKSSYAHEHAANYFKIATRLTEENYIDFLHMLLYIEENQMRIDIRDYDCVSTLKRIEGSSQALYELQVPGLSEARPSLLRKDSVYVKFNKSDLCKFQGIVHKVLQSSVHLGFNKRFVSKYLKDQKVNIEFGFNRRTLKVEHQALDILSRHNVVSYLFPTECPDPIRTRIFSENCQNRTLNAEQKTAIRNILNIKNAPYILFGPPGTGKTTTFVEAIYQVWKNYPESHFLVCAPSNTACNEIAFRLLKFIPKSELYRLIGSIYGIDHANFTDLIEISNITGTMESFLPSMEFLLKKRILLTTTVTAARLINGGIPPNHFLYVFIDEAGYATETETLIPFAGILSDNDQVTGQLVLAGDPRQLGPRIHSTFTNYCSLGISMLERLMDTIDIYARDEKKSIPHNEKCVTKLTKNYRSHPEILKIPNKLFYNNDLEAMGNPQIRMFCDWEYLPKKNFPVLFHNIEGEDRQDPDSPSFYNIQEVEIVMKYLKCLINERVKGAKIEQSHIGIITPYRKQIEKLQRACNKKNWKEIQIGSVEQFQGREKLIIIITTVRSKSDKNLRKHDEKFSLGFLRNPKRINVALTRAKALLIVVGNAGMLKTDENWRAFIEHCEANQSLVGNKKYVEIDEDQLSESDEEVEEEIESSDFSRGII